MGGASRSAAVCGLFTRCITVGICLLSSGGYVTAELDKTWRGDRTAQRTTLVHVHTHTPHSHLGEQTLLQLKTLISSLTGLKVWARCYPAVLRVCNAISGRCLSSRCSGACVSLITGHSDLPSFPSHSLPAKSSIRDQM